ncbi:MAG: M48 family metalloprotease [Kiritimatiellaeota bacterium]|nr:M48 family metalloprotease [Kiritimatiellota bacterium]
MKFQISNFKFQIFAALLSFVIVLAGCTTVTKMTTGVLQATGTINQQQADSINRSAEAVEKTFKDITPEQEYYIGRSVAATILSTYKPYDNEAATHYVNVLGQALALSSDRPETFRGYHFVIMDTDEINAFSAPGGFVMVSRGLLRCCRNEDAIAAVLAHEVGHVENQHGLKAIKGSRLTGALTILALEAGKNLGGQNRADVAKAVEVSISDITSSLVNKGYSSSLEYQADTSAVKIMKRVGYNPAGLLDMLGQMKQHMPPGSAGFGKTHPDPEKRISEASSAIGTPASLVEPATRQARFAQFLRTI